MNNIPNPYSTAGFSSRHNSPAGLHAAGYAKQDSIKAHENLDTGLVIKTKEGDQVTISSNSYFNLDAFMYDSKGVVRTESGAAAFSHSLREISLSSGQSFSFVVEGDLSESELEDIEAIIQDLDQVIAEMTSGDMFGAVGKALEMGNYDTVSAFAADISYERTYAMSSAATAAAASILPGQTQSTDQTSLAEPKHEQPAAGRHLLGPRQDHRPGFNRFLNKMADHLTRHNEKELKHAQQPIDKLFKHHLDRVSQGSENSPSLYQALESAMKQVESMIDEIASGLFEKQLEMAEDD